MSVRIAGRSGVYRLRGWHEAREHTDSVAEPLVAVELRNDPVGALAFARELASSPGGVARLRVLLVTETAAIFRLEDEAVIRLLASRLATGSLLAHRVLPPALSSFDVGASEVEAEAAPAPATEEKTWIEIELVDTEGNPVPNERYWILLTDGTTREGRLDQNGRAYFGGLDPGECDVRFPDLDNEAVASPSEPRSIQFPARPVKTWVEIELIGMDGSPIPGELYRLTLPDGKVQEGRLDENGCALVLGIDPGDCVVTFPALDEEAWEEVR